MASTACRLCGHPIEHPRRWYCADCAVIVASPRLLAQRPLPPTPLPLSVREQFVLERRDRGDALETIGRALAVGKERVRQIEAVARWCQCRTLIT